MPKRKRGEDDDEWIPEDERKKRRKLERDKNRDPEEYFPDTDDDEKPDDYLTVQEYIDGYDKNYKLSRYEDYLWVRPVGNRIAIYFKPEHVEDTKTATISQNREESQNRGDLNLTWHHTDEFYPKGKCFMQLVPTSIHSTITHIGGVSLSPQFRRKMTWGKGYVWK